MHIHMQVEAVSVFFHHLSLIAWAQGLSLNEKFTVITELAGQWAPADRLSLSLQCGDYYGHVQPCQAFNVGAEIQIQVLMFAE